MDAVTHVPVPVNEPVRAYAPGSPDRAALEAKIKELAGERILLARQFIALVLVAASVVTAGTTSSEVAALAFAVTAVIASGAGLLGWHRMDRDHPRH